MQRIYPVTEQNCREHCGKPVLIYLVDGSEIYGMLSRVDGGRLILNEQAKPSSSGQITTSRQKAMTRAAKKKTGSKVKKARTTSFPDPAHSSEPYDAAPGEFGQDGRDYFFSGYGGPGAPLVLDLTSIAALIVLV